MRYGNRSHIDRSMYVSKDVDLSIGDGSYVGPGVHIVGSGRVTFGDYCKIHAGSFINVGTGGWVTFGHNCWFGEQTVLDGAGGLTGGNNIGAGIGSQLYSHIAHGDTIEGCLFESKNEMMLEDDVWFVGQCFVSPVRAGSKSVALLGSVITKDMHANRVYGGNPAQDITDRIGPAWVERTAQEKYVMLCRRFEEYCSIFPDQAFRARKAIVPCTEYPTDMDPNVTYFNVTRRRYTKRSTEDEWRFMSWLISYRGRFIPETQ